jgi:hypothetical protein
MLMDVVFVLIVWRDGGWSGGGGEERILSQDFVVLFSQECEWLDKMYWKKRKTMLVGLDAHTYVIYGGILNTLLASRRK